MKKQLFLGLAVASSVVALAQQNQKVLLNTTPAKSNLNKYSTSTYEPDFVTPSKKSGPVNSTLATPYKRIGGSVNTFGVFIPESRCLQYNPYINTVGLVYRQNFNLWTGIPNGNSGTVSFAWSSNNGGSWDSTVVSSGNTTSGLCQRYPNGIMYSPTSNTVSSNAFAVVAGPYHDCAATSMWTGNYFASKQLTAPGTNSNSASNVKYVDNTALTVGQVKQDFVRVNPQVTSDGVIHLTGELVDNINATPSVQKWRGISLNKGMYSAGTFTWTVDSIKPMFKLGSAGDQNADLTPNVAWSENGMIGYVAFFGVDANALPQSNQDSYIPFVFKTIDAGATWNRFAPLFDFKSIAAVNSRLTLVGNSVSASSTQTILPFVNSNEGSSATVDAAGNLHLFSRLIGGINEFASIDSLKVFNVNFNTRWNYLVDFKTTSTGWDAVVLDSLSCARTSTANTNWVGSGASPSGPLTYGARFQISRTADGKQIFYSWADSDSTIVSSPHESLLPDIFQMGYDVILNKFTCKKNMTLGKVGAEKQAYFHFTSPIVAKPTVSTFLIPTSFVKSDDGTNNADIAISQYYIDDNIFSATEFTVTPNTVGCVALTGAGINEAASSISDLSFYPNPTANDGTISVTINENAKVKIAVLNAVGQVVYSTTTVANVGNNKFEVNLSQLSSGLYFYQVQVANNKAVTKKFVIEK